MGLQVYYIFTYSTLGRVSTPALLQQQRADQAARSGGLGCLPFSLLAASRRMRVTRAVS